MEVNTQQQQSIWTGIIELTKSAQHRSTDPLTWAVQLSSALSSAGVSLPSIEASKLIVDYICWENNVPITWKFLEMALTMKILPPMLVLALLSVRSSFHSTFHSTFHKSNTIIFFSSQCN